MAVNRAEFSVAVKSTFDSQGTEAAKTGFAQMSAQLKALEADMALAQRTGVSVPQESLDKIASLKNAVANYGLVLEKTGVSHREVHQGLHLVAMAAGDALGPIGELSRMLGDPYIMAAAGAAMAIKMLVEQHQALQEQAVKNLTAYQEMHEQFDDAHTQAVINQADALNKHRIAAERASEAVDLVAESLKNQLAILHQSKSATDDLIAAREGLYEANIKAAEAAGLLDQTEADFATRHAKDQEEKQKDAAADALAQKEMELKKKNVEDTRRRGAGEYQASDAAAKTAARLDEAVFDTQNRIDDLKDQLPALKEKYRDLQATANQHYGQRGHATMALAADKAKEALENIMGQWKSQTLHLADLKRQQDAANSLAQTQFDHAEKDRLAADAEEREIAATDDLTKEKIKQRNILENVQHETQRVERQTALRNKINAGTATPDEILRFNAEMDTGGTGPNDKRPGEPGYLEAWQRPVGQQGARDFTSLIGRGNTLLQKLTRERPQDRSAADVQQLHDIFSTMEGFLDSTSDTVRTLAGHYTQLQGRMNDLLTEQQAIQARLDNNRPNTGG